ncbi:MAG: hypothetical protein Tsb009_15510 [Planctomycetaceae bacterium]
MRLQHWFTAVVCFVSLICASNAAHAQGDFNPYASSPYYGAAPVGYDEMPGTLSQVSAPAPIPHFSARLSTDMNVNGVPPGMLPYPAISPFDHRYSEHSIENGLWMHDSNNRPRKYYGGVSAVLFRLRKPEQALFGDPAFRAVATNPPYTIGTANGSDHVFDKNFKTEGIRIHWGFIDADNTGLEATAWWATDVTQQFKLGQDIDPGDPGTAIVAPSIPVANGGAGDSLDFDRLFRIRYVQEAVSTHADRLFAPWWKSNNILVRPMGGVRYMYLREGMHFSGINGGPPVTVSALNTNIRSHLVGPQLGLQGVIGGKSFRIISGTRVIIFANIEKLRMEGDNFGSAAIVAAGAVNSFSQTITNAHVSPAFEQTIHMEANVLQFVPYLNTFAIMRNATFRAGFTFFNVAEVARPSRSVRYRGLPQLPELKADRSKWSFISWDFGVNFVY